MKATERVYLDYAAATPLDPEVQAAMLAYQGDNFANPSSLYAEGRAAKLALENARKDVAKVLGARAGEIVFTAGATEALNLAIQGAQKSYPQATILACASDHQAVLATVEALGGAIYPVKKNGRINRPQLEKLIDDNVVLVCVSHVNSELGTIQPIAEVGELVRQVRADRMARGVDLPLYLLCDSSAGAGQVSLQVSRLGVDIMILNGAKMYGPNQAGALYIKNGTSLSPTLFGGGQERGLRSGSESVASAVGIATSLSLADSRRVADQKEYSQLRTNLLKELETIPGFALNNTQHSVASIINFRIAGASGEDLLYKLDADGFAVATGAACSASTNQPSHVLLAIGLTKEEAGESLRISMGRDTTAEQLMAFSGALKRLIVRT